MTIVRVVQPAFDEIIDVVAVRHLFVAAIVVRALAIDRGTDRRVRRTHRDDVFVIMSRVGVVEVAVVQEIDVPLVFDACVAAMFAVDMLVVVVCLTGHLASLPRMGQKGRMLILCHYIGARGTKT